ncbi:hypothetical protein [Sporolactobacillus vineae]|uniref:hypothetical protein n=1 Tax=Sporolactobacillus vineae TaxID=444463 RepID=UPI00028874E4|nr:hypothetical protein [Sporolactobacillus vineae]
MNSINQTLNRKDAEKRIPILKMEIDTQLGLLHHALISKDMDTVTNCKAKLEKLRREMLLLEI